MRPMHYARECEEKKKPDLYEVFLCDNECKTPIAVKKFP